MRSQVKFRNVFLYVVVVENIGFCFRDGFMLFLLFLFAIIMNIIMIIIVVIFITIIIAIIINILNLHPILTIFTYQPQINTIIISIFPS